ncbi:MAG: hypothetical protein DRN14_00210 [Thermoplasmata archaeon]|nr:MAG: hypothetical protein DRN14_00210 [Thermoplasmata archaeon]
MIETYEDEIVRRTYPGAYIVGIAAMYIDLGDRRLWYDTLISTREDALAIIRRGVDAYGRTILALNLVLDIDGRRVYPDYRVDELKQ